MSIAHELGFDLRDPQQLACTRWVAWSAQHPALEAVDPSQLQEWLGRTRDPGASAEQHAEVDAVLRGLARLAAEDDGDDHDAAHVLAWAMLPAAIAVARSLRRAASDIDQTVATNLWIGVRTFRWRSRQGSVAANIARDLRSAVLADLGLDAGARRHLTLVPTDPTSLELVPDVRDPHARGTALDDLFGLLDSGCAAGAISWADRALLLSLIEVADRLDTTHQNSVASGLLSATITAEVARELGVSARHVRRRVTASVTALGRLGIA